MPIGYDNKPTCLGTVLDIPMYESSGTVVHDVSGNQNHGACTNVTWTQLASGVWRNVFNGASSEIDCGLGTSLNITGDWSLALWAWHNAAMGNGVVVSKDNVSGVGRSWNLDTQTNAPRIYVFSATGNQNCQATTVINNGVPHFIVATSDGANLNLYIDGGSEIVSNAWNGGLYPAVASKTYIGRRHHATPVWYLGSLALPRIFNRALSAQEIKQIYSSERDLFGV